MAAKGEPSKVVLATARTGVLKPGGTPRQLALGPGGMKLLVVDTDSGQVRANQIARLP